MFVYAAHSMLARAHGMCGYYDNDISNDVTDVSLHPLANVYALAAYYRDTSDVRDVITLTSSSYSDVHPCVTLQLQGVEVQYTSHSLSQPTELNFHSFQLIYRELPLPKPHTLQF